MTGPLLALGSLGPRTIAWYHARRSLRLSLEGLEHLPRRGPALIVARHYHHLYDGAALVMMLPRMVHIFVALDWVRNRRERIAMELACAAARWPVALRAQTMPAGETNGAYEPAEIARYVRRSLNDAVKLLCEGRVVAIFPEGTPTIEPFGVRTRADDEIGPFAPGFAAIAALAQRRLGRPVPLVPAGLRYEARERTGVTLVLGAPLTLEAFPSRTQAAAELRSCVRDLSGV